MHARTRRQAGERIFLHARKRENALPSLAVASLDPIAVLCWCCLAVALRWIEIKRRPCLIPMPRRAVHTVHGMVTQ